MPKPAKPVVYQTHHITYDPEWTVRIRKSEHWTITQLQRFAALTPGAKQAIKFILMQKPTFIIREQGGTNAN